jgi:hypothetical protein
MAHSITNNNFPSHSTWSNSATINNYNNLEEENMASKVEPSSDDEPDQEKENNNNDENNDENADESIESENSYYIEPICLKFSRRKLLIGYSIIYRGRVIRTHIFPLFRLMLSSRRLKAMHLEINKTTKMPFLQNTFVNNNNNFKNLDSQFSYPIVNRNKHLLFRNVFVNNN